MVAANELVREVAAPGSVFWETVRHPDNIEILEGDERTRTLPADRLHEAKQKIALLQAELNVYFQAYIDHLQTRRARIASKDKADERLVIDQAIGKARERIKPARRPRGKAMSIRRAGQAREALVMLRRLEARVAEHERAVENARLNRKLQDEMMTEISFYAQQIIERWSALGYREEYTVDGKTHLRKVYFEEAHFTEDNIQFKIYVSHLTLLGSTIHHLPDKVRAWDLIKPETLRELEAACECPVTSPHSDEDQGFEKGAWVVVHRVGMRDGLFNYVELSAVLAKYNQGLRPHFAVPVGIKAGRAVEYLHLDKVPHIMFNGITGSGKTNIARVFLSVWCQFYTPDEIRFILVDLKRSGDLNHFSSVPHLIGSIVKTVESLAELMPKLLALMHFRMGRLSGVNSTGIEDFNRKAEAADRMARIVVLIDECGAITDLSSSREQRETIWRCLALLATQARAAGIHLMLGTQQPSKDAIPSRVSNNITYTLSGRQRTTSGAMMALGNNRLKDLPAIQGRMLVDNGFTLVPVQTPEATDDSILKAVAAAKDQPAPAAFELPSLDDDELPSLLADVLPSAPAVNSDEMIHIAVTRLDGVMNPRRIHEIAGGKVSRRAIEQAIKTVTAAGTLTHEGVTYAVTPFKRGHRLAPVAAAKVTP